MQAYSNLIDIASGLNDMLHVNRVSERYRAILISSILIALVDDGFRASYLAVDESDLVDELVNTAIRQLKQSGLEQECLDVLKQKFGFLTTEQVLTRSEGELKSIIEYVDRKINSFVSTNKYCDVLGVLYVHFLQSANTDKGLGIVLTPMHITELCVELAGVDHDSVVFDNCAGTGSFLIAALKRMIDCAQGDVDLENRIRKSQLHGVEIQSSIYPLVASNMYINQDGNVNVLLGSCFDKQIIDAISRKNPTVGLLNPPFKSNKKTDIEEFKFVLNNLDCLAPNGVCVAILPMQCALAVRGRVGELKREIMRRHTLEAVLSLPNNLFGNSKVGAVACAMIFTAHRPHSDSETTYFGYCKDDGFTKRKPRGWADYDGRWNSIRERWIAAYKNRSEIPGFSVCVPVGSQDEWSAEAYLVTDYSKLCRENFESTIADYSTFLFINKIRKQVSDESCVNETDQLNSPQWQWFGITDLFDVAGTKTTPLLRLQEIGEGVYPYITTKAQNNGVYGFFQHCTENLHSRGVITVDSAVAGYCSYHNTPFSASDHVEMLVPRFDLNVFVAMFLVTVLNFEQYRYNYGRACSMERLRKCRIKLPATIDGQPDFQYMRQYIRELPYSSNLR